MKTLYGAMVFFASMTTASIACVDYPQYNGGQDVGRLPLGTDNALAMCIKGDFGIVACGQEPMHRSNIAPGRLAKIMQQRARLRAQSALAAYVSEADLVALDGFSDNTTLTTTGTGESFSSNIQEARLSVLKTKLLRGIFVLHMDQNQQEVIICLASSLRSQNDSGTLQHNSATAVNRARSAPLSPTPGYQYQQASPEVFAPPPQPQPEYIIPKKTWSLD